MHVAVLSLRDPVPVYTGLLERTYQTCCFLGERHEVQVFYPYEKRRKESEEGRVPDHQPFERRGLRSTVIDVLERVIPDYSPLKGAYHLHPWLYPQLRSQLRDFDPDVLVVEIPYLVPLAKAAGRKLDCAIILSEHNVEYKFAKRLDIPLWRLLRGYEHTVCNCVDAVLTVSEADRETLEPHLDEDVLTAVAPNGVDTERYTPGRKRATETIREHYDLTPPVFIFHGNLGNAQNAEVVRLLQSEVFPVLRGEFETASLLLVGSDPPESTPPGVVTTGIVHDLPEHLAAADVALAPMLSGSGTNLKIVEYLATGLPVVTTPIGAEGLPLDDGYHVLVSEPADVAEQAVHIVKDNKLAERLRTNGHQLAKAEFSWSNTLSPYEDIIEQVVEP